MGPELAYRLGLPYATYVHKFEIKDSSLIVERDLDDGTQVLKLTLPALVTIVKEIGEPRVPSIRGKMRAKKAKIPIWTAEEIEADKEKLGLNGSPTRVVNVFSPPARGKKEIFTGKPDECVRQLCERVREVIGM